MKIAIIGGGSLGLLFAHYLNDSHQVHVYVRSKEQKSILSSNGLILEKNGQKYIHAIGISLFSEWKGEEDLTIIAVKQYHLQNLLNQMAETMPLYEGSLLFLQNGMGHLKWLETMKKANIYVGTVEHGANKVSLNHVIHTGKGMTRLALYRGYSLTILKELLNTSIDEFPFSFEEDYEEMLVKKLIVNAVINPLTAVLNIRNGELLDNPYYYNLFKKVFEEISNVLKVQEKSKSFTHLENVCKETAANRSSMLQDLDGNRPTEVDAILGYVLEKAGELGVDTPLTESFYNAIKGKEY